MAKKTNQFEMVLRDIFAKDAPTLPKNSKRVLVQWVPVLSVLIGVLTLLGVWSLWHWARLGATTNVYNSVCYTYSGYVCGAPASRFTIWLWLGMGILAVEGFLYLLAYSDLKAHSKDGWDYLYYGALLNVVYAIVSLFAADRTVYHFIGALVCSIIGLYLLFQVRDAYLAPTRIAPVRTADKKHEQSD